MTWVYQMIGFFVKLISRKNLIVLYIGGLSAIGAISSTHHTMYYTVDEIPRIVVQ